MSFDVLTINPGSTSTKLAVYQGDKVLFEETVRHTMQELADFNNVQEQFDFRWQVLRRVMDAFGYDVKNLQAVVGRGGLLLTSCWWYIYGYRKNDCRFTSK